MTIRRRAGTHVVVAVLLMMAAGPAWSDVAPPGPEPGAPPGPVASPGSQLEPVPALVGRGWVDTTNRAAVVARYLATFKTAVPDAGWTGNVASCQAGTLSNGYRSAILDRVNWYRAMAGTLDGVVEDPAFTTEAQAAALIMSANNALSHSPPTSWACWTTTGNSGAANSNLFIGKSGVAAVDGFIEDPGTSNSAVGHRSWLLEPTQVRMGVGAIPSGGPLTEAVKVIDPPNLFTSPPPPTREGNGFVSWPPRGFVPSSTVYPRWSLHNNGADFSAATVQVVVGGQPVATTVEHRGPATTSRPGPDITFAPTMPAFSSQSDLPVTVTVSGVGGTGMPSTYSWTTTIIPPPTVLKPPPEADYNGDAKTDLAVFRPGTGAWYVAYNGGGTTSATWGLSGDIPVPGDYNGDAKTDFAIFRPATGTWYVAYSGGGTTSVNWGIAGDMPVPLPTAVRSVYFP